NNDPFFVGNGRPQTRDFKRGDRPAWLAIRLAAIPRLDGDVEAAALLSQVQHYLQRGNDGRYQLSIRQLASDCGLALKTVRRCLQLIEGRYIVTDKRGCY